jgi:hypothetical protein
LRVFDRFSGVVFRAASGTRSGTFRRDVIKAAATPNDGGRELGDEGASVRFLLKTF